MTRTVDGSIGDAVISWFGDHGAWLTIVRHWALENEKRPSWSVYSPRRARRGKQAGYVPWRGMETMEPQSYK